MKATTLLSIFTIILALPRLSVCSTETEATETVDGIEWRYTIINDTASIGHLNKKTKGAIVIPSQLGGFPVTTIGRRAFEDCEKLTSVKIPDSVTSIGFSAFAKCFGLTSITIPNGVTSIGDSAFFRCTGLASVTISSSVTNIVTSAFSGCSAITSFDVSPKNHCYVSIDGVLFSKDKTTLIRFPSGRVGVYDIPEGVTCIAAGAFGGAKNLFDIGIPDSVIKIGPGAFHGCEAITRIKIPDAVTSISRGTFSGCRALESIILPNAVTEIGYSAFSDCRLQSLVIPNTVTNIGGRAFHYSFGPMLKSIAIPESVMDIGDEAFAGNYFLENLSLHMRFKGKTSSMIDSPEMKSRCKVTFWE